MNKDLVYCFLDRLVGFPEFVMANAVHAVASHDENITNIELGFLCTAIFVCFHPLIHAVGKASIIKILCDLYITALLSRSFDPKEVFSHAGKHISEKKLFALLRNAIEKIAHVHYRLRGVYANRPDVGSGLELGQFPAVAVRLVIHQDFAIQNPKDSLELAFVVDVACGLLFGFDGLPEHHADKTDVRPLGEHDVVDGELNA